MKKYKKLFLSMVTLSAIFASSITAFANENSISDFSAENTFVNENVLIDPSTKDSDALIEVIESKIQTRSIAGQVQATVSFSNLKNCITAEGKKLKDGDYIIQCIKGSGYQDRVHAGGAYYDTVNFTEVIESTKRLSLSTGNTVSLRLSNANYAIYPYIESASSNKVSGTLQYLRTGY